MPLYILAISKILIFICERGGLKLKNKDVFNVTFVYSAQVFNGNFTPQVSSNATRDFNEELEITSDVKSIKHEC